MSDDGTMKKSAKHAWRRFDVLTDEEVHAAEDVSAFGER